MTILRTVFALVGSAMLIVAGVSAYQTRAFLHDAVLAQGEVVRLEERRSRGSNGDSVTYTPVVRFRDETGQFIEYAAGTSGYPPAFLVGEQAGVYYRPGQNGMRLDTILDLWGTALFFSGMGAVFAGIGFTMIASARRTARRNKFLRANGTRLETDFQSVELNTSLSVNGRHPFRIVSQWQNPRTQLIHIFHSEDVWFDPTRYVGARPIVVFIDPGNPDIYTMDTDFLPSLAEQF